LDNEIFIMKKILFFIFLFFGYSLYAQRFKGGLILGLNSTQVDGDTYAGYNKFGIAAGFYVYTPITDNIDVQMEIKYMGKGARKNSTSTNPGLYINQLDYIEIPLMFDYKTSEKIALNGGLGFGYLFNTAIKDDYGKISGNFGFKSFELSGIAGMNYVLTDMVKVYLRFSYSILPILISSEPQTFFLRRRVYNNCLSIGFNYSFKINR